MKELILKDIVKEVLEECPNSRNNDNLLILLTLRKLGVRIYIEDLKKMPSLESITRARRFWQNTKGILLPTVDIDAMRSRRELDLREVYA